MQEELFPIKGYEDYGITKSGKIWSYPKYFRKGLFLKFSKRNGYYFLRLTKNKKQKNICIHRLMAETFIPNPENKPCINHKNGIKTDNRIENLEWCTNKENSTHAVKYGLMSFGEHHGLSKLRDEDVYFIINSIGKITTRTMATMLNVSEVTINNVKSGRSWKHLIPNLGGK
jgi:hypothetical protein